MSTKRTYIRSTLRRRGPKKGVTGKLLAVYSVIVAVSPSSFYSLLSPLRPPCSFCFFLRYSTKPFYVNLVDRLLFYIRTVRLYSFGLLTNRIFLAYTHRIIMVHFHKSESCMLFYAT